MPAVVDSSEEVRAEPKPRKGWFFNPYTQLLLSIILSAAAQFFLKKGATKTAVPEIWLGVEGLWSGLGVARDPCDGHEPFLVALQPAVRAAEYCVQPWQGSTQVLVPLVELVAAWGTDKDNTRACGILPVCAGVFVVARPLIQVEEKL